jgi:hypothetical protein
MGRLGKVASPALCGNANQRLMRHKLADTTLCERSDTESSRKLRSCGSARRPAAVRAVPAPTAHFRPNRPFFVARGMQTRRAAPRYTSATRWQSAGNACVKPRGRAGARAGLATPAQRASRHGPAELWRQYGGSPVRDRQHAASRTGACRQGVAGTGGSWHRSSRQGPRHTPADSGPAEGSYPGAGVSRRSGAAIAAAAAPGSGAPVMGRPITSRLAPARSASSGVAVRA